MEIKKHNIATTVRSDDRLERETAGEFPLGRRNFIYMAISGALIVIGFLLMLGGSSTEQAFNPDIFSARRIIVGPALAFIGFVAMGVSIIVSPRSRKENNPETDKI